VTRPPAFPKRTHDFPLPSSKGNLPIVDSILHADLLPEVPAFELTAGQRHYRDPFVGVTLNGTPRRNLYTLTDTGTRPNDAVAAAHTYLDTLPSHQRTVAQLPMNSPDWRLWTNAIPTWTPKGMKIERLSDHQRNLVLDVIRASLSETGYSAVRSAMQLNGALGELIDDYRDTLTEFSYWFTVFGEPTSGEPWGWQLMGHHIDLHCVFIDSQIVFAPVFLGAEPSRAVAGTYEGVYGFSEETDRGVALRRALKPDQEHQYLLGNSLAAQDLPAELAGPWNGRHLAGAGADNLILPPEGIAGANLTAAQQQLLIDLVRVYVDRLPKAHASAKLDEVVRHLEETYFAWRGGSDDECPFYYRIHSPVLLVEYDNHPGVFLANTEAARYHIHTIVREPNGNDYGKDLLTQHYAAHHNGRH